MLSRKKPHTIAEAKITNSPWLFDRNCRFLGRICKIGLLVSVSLTLVGCQTTPTVDRNAESPLQTPAIDSVSEMAMMQWLGGELSQEELRTFRESEPSTAALEVLRRVSNVSNLRVAQDEAIDAVVLDSGSLVVSRGMVNRLTANPYALVIACHEKAHQTHGDPHDTKIGLGIENYVVGADRNLAEKVSKAYSINTDERAMQLTLTCYGDHNVSQLDIVAALGYDDSLLRWLDRHPAMARIWQETQLRIEAADSAASLKAVNTITSGPGARTLLRRQGAQALAAGRYAAAEHVFSRLVFIDSNYYHDQLGLAIARFELGQYQAALDAAQRSLRLLETADAWNLVGKIYAQAGESETAVRAFANAFKSPTPAGRESLEELAKMDAAGVDKVVAVNVILAQSGKQFVELENLSAFPIKEVTFEIADAEGWQRMQYHDAVAGRSKVLMALPSSPLGQGRQIRLSSFSVDEG